MGWVWKDDDDDRNSSKINDLNPKSEAQSSTRKIIYSQCRTEEVEPGKFIKKCEKTEQLLKDYVCRPSEVVQSNKEYTEEDVTKQIKTSSLSSHPTAFDFPGLKRDIEAIERNLFGNMTRFFGAAEDIKNGFFNIFESPHLYNGDSKTSPPSFKHSVPVEARPPSKAVKPKPRDGHVDLSELAQDV